MRRALWYVLAMAVGLGLAPGSAWSDAIIITRAMTASTIAEAFIDSGSIRVELEIGFADLAAFRNLLPDELYEKLGYSPSPLGDRLAIFFSQDWVMRGDDGEPIAGRIAGIEAGRRIQRDEITGEPATVQPEDAEGVVRVSLIYPVESNPATLRFKPPTDSEDGGVRANIGFVTYHVGLPVNDFRYLSEEETLDLDWDDPWFSRFRNRNLWRQYDSPISAFLYVEYFEVRKEIVVRPKDLQRWVDLGLQGTRILKADEQDALKTRVAEFLIERCPVRIDGQTIEPTLDRIHFIRRTLRKTGVIDSPEDLDVTSATLGVIFVYPISELPQEVEMRWDLFSDRITSVPGAATDEAGGLPCTLTPTDPVLRWQNFLTNPTIPAMMAVALPTGPAGIRIPMISAAFVVGFVGVLVRGARGRGRDGTWPRGAVLTGILFVLGALGTSPFLRVPFRLPISVAGEISQQEAEDLLAALLHNIYRAFDWREESAIYDRLALSIGGDLLSDVYLQTRRTMELEGQGGARVKVDTVDVLDAERGQTTENGGLVFRCRWNVSGSVGHWGHIHRRTNQYDAVFTIEPVNDAWKIVGMDLRDETRIDARVGSGGGT